MFIPNLPCVVRKKGRPDVYGQVGTGAESPEKCAIVKLKSESKNTALRADSGASRSHADEFVTDNLFLLTKNTAAAIDDQLDVIGYKIRIKMLHPRYDILGNISHFEVSGELWG